MDPAPGQARGDEGMSRGDEGLARGDAWIIIWRRAICSFCSL